MGEAASCRLNRGFLSLPIDVASVPNCTHDERLLIVKNLIYHSIIADAKFVESGELASQCFQASALNILGKPTHALNDAARHWSVKA